MQRSHDDHKQSCGFGFGLVSCQRIVNIELGGGCSYSGNDGIDRCNEEPSRNPAGSTAERNAEDT